MLLIISLSPNCFSTISQAPLSMHFTFYLPLLPGVLFYHFFPFNIFFYLMHCHTFHPFDAFNRCSIDYGFERMAKKWGLNFRFDSILSSMWLATQLMLVALLTAGRYGILPALYNASGMSTSSIKSAVVAPSLSDSRGFGQYRLPLVPFYFLHHPLQDLYSCKSQNSSCVRRK